MQTRVQCCGDQLAVLIPAQLVSETGLVATSMVEIEVVGGAIVVRMPSADIALAELLKKVTPENLHSEWETGPATGVEAW